MGPLTLTRSAEEHGGPHEPWFCDPTRQGGGVLLDMGCHSIAVGRHVLTPPDKDLLFLQPVSVSADLGLLKWGQKKWRDKLLKDRGVVVRVERDLDGPAEAELDGVGEKVGDHLLEPEPIPVPEDTRLGGDGQRRSRPAELSAELSRRSADDLDEVDLLHLLDERDRIAAFAAAEALVGATRRRHREARRLLLMERAKALVRAARLSQPDVVLDERENLRCRLHGLDRRVLDPRHDQAISAA